MKLHQRIARYARITWRNLALDGPPSPPFLVLFATSACNMRCGHCFYWRQLNRRDDLTREELLGLSNQLGRVENLYLSGGEPFMREGLAEVCRKFVRDNRTREIYIPTNGYFTQRIIQQLDELLDEPGLALVAVELSLDGLAETHDALRATPGAFEHALETYRALARLQEKHRRLVIHAVSTATAENLQEIRRLTTFLYERCPRISHHNLAIIRGDRRTPSLQGPALTEYAHLWDYLRRLWADRERNRYGGIVEPMLHWAKVRTAEARRQIVPCRAGVLSAVVYANGDVAFCEQHEPIGNLRSASFDQLWRGGAARRLRAAIGGKRCYCTNEVFLWPSITFQPRQLLRAMTSARPFHRPEPLPEHMRAKYEPLVDATRSGGAEEGGQSTP